MSQLILSALLILTFSSTAISSTYKTEIIEKELTSEEHELLDQSVGPGEIIAMADSIVALGEKLYTLFQKGKPSSQVKYAPISIIPRDKVTKEPVDVFDLEGDAEPVRKKFTIAKKNGLGNEVGRLDILIHFTPGRSLNGAGQYITNASIIPLKANTLYGWDLAATMVVSGVGTKGKSSNPIATATLTLSYQLNSVITAINEAVVIDIDGTGKVVITE